MGKYCIVLALLIAAPWASASSLGDVAVARGTLDLKAGNHVEAEASFREALALDEDAPRARAGLAMALIGQRRGEDAILILKEQLAAKPGDPVLTSLLGQAYVVAGKSPEAAGTLDEFQAGMVRFHQGRWADALAHFRRVTPRSRDAADYLKLYEGIALSRLGRADEARRAFEGLGASTADPTLAELAGQLKAQPLVQPVVARRKRTRGLVKIAGQYDDNPAVAPTTNVFGLGRKRESAGNLLNGTVQHDLVAKQDRVLTASYAFLQTLNYDASDVNLQDHAVALTGVRSTEQNGRTIHLGAQASYDNLLVDDASFIQRASFTPYVTLFHTPKRSTTFSLQLQSKDFLNEGFVDGTQDDRDADNLQLGVAHAATYGREDRYLAQAAMYVDDENTKGANVDYEGVRFVAGAAGPFLDSKLTFSTQIGLHLRQYANVHTLFGLVREDDDYTFFGSLSYPLEHDARLSLEYLRNRNISNIALFDFERNTTSLAYTRAF
jgi:Flp pilus assembly protein TadD